MNINNSEDIQNKVILSPNPVSDILHIQYNNNRKLTSVRIFNTTGKEVFINAPYSEDCIDVSAITAGVYFLQTTIGNSTSYSRFIKQ